MMRESAHAFGWLHELPDIRDWTYQVAPALQMTLPPLVDLRDQCPPVVDQGRLGSCTAQACANAHYFAQLREATTQAFLPSRLMLYCGERVLEHTTKYDAGAYLRDGIKVLAQAGACPEPLW